MIRRPPRSTLFPTRRSSDLRHRQRARREEIACVDRHPRHAFWELRSEEHTSELQSRSDLVCRLLLEKKNIKSKPVHVILVANHILKITTTLAHITSVFSLYA